MADNEILENVDRESGDDEVDEAPERSESNGSAETAVSKLLQRITSSGAAIVKRAPSSTSSQASIPVLLLPPRCVTCKKNFPDRKALHEHLITKHIQMPDLILEKLPSDDDISDDDNEQDWSDEEQDIKVPIKPADATSSIGKYLTGFAGISIRKTTETISSSLSLKPKVLPINDGSHGPPIVLGRKPAVSFATRSGPSRKDAESPPQKIVTPGALKMTFKQSGPKDKFQIVQNMKEIPIKIENNPPTEIDSKSGIMETFQNSIIKTEPVSQSVAANDALIDSIKSEPGETPNEPIKVKSFANRPAAEGIPKPIIVLKKEPEVPCVVIELNGDSDKDDDDDAVIFVPSSPPPDKKPTLEFPSIPRKPHITEIVSTPPPPPLTLLSEMVSTPPTSQSAVPVSSSGSSGQVSTAKQHNFSWNPPTTGVRDPFDTNPVDRSSDALFESLLAPSGQRKDSDPGPSEYISLDRLGPQHTCEVCQTRFTDLSLLDRHRKTTGHSSQLVMTSTSGGAVLPSYGTPSASNFLNSLFPAAKLAETVGKLAGAPFTQQQNIMVNIQSFPGAMGQGPGQPGQSGMPPGYGFPGVPNMQGPYPPQGYGQPPSNQYQQQYSQQPYADTYGQFQQQNQQAPYNPQSASQQNYGPSCNYQNSGQYSGYPMHSGPKAGAGTYSQGISGHPPAPNQIQPGSNHETLNSTDSITPSTISSPSSGIRIQVAQPSVSGVTPVRLAAPMSLRGALRGAPRLITRPRGVGPRGAAATRPTRPTLQLQGQAIRGSRPGIIRTPIKRPAPASNGASQSSPKRRLEMLVPDRHDNSGSKEKSVQLSDQITVTKTRVKPPTPPPVAKDAGTVASMLAMRGIKITQKVKSPSPPPLPIPNLGSNISVTKSSGSSASNFIIPGDDIQCSMCSKTFANLSALSVHTSQFHALSPKTLRCDSCPVSYSTAIQLQEHKRVFHNQGTAAEMGLPVVDLSQQANMRKLNSLGIVNFIPLANREQGGGCFGIPVVSSQSLNGALNSSLQALGAAGILSLGPIKPLPRC